MASRPSDGPRHPVQAFRVDPGWYARHWLEPEPARPPGPADRILAKAWTALRVALQSARNTTRRIGAAPPAGRLLRTQSK